MTTHTDDSRDDFTPIRTQDHTPTKRFPQLKTLFAELLISGFVAAEPDGYRAVLDGMGSARPTSMDETCRAVGSEEASVRFPIDHKSDDNADDSCAPNYANDIA